MKILNIVFHIALVSSLGACVSSHKHHELEAEHQKALESLASSEARVSDLEGKLGIVSTERSRLEGDVADMKKAISELNARRAEAEKRITEFKDLTSKFKTMVDAGKLSVKIAAGRMVVALSTDVLFASGSAKLSKAGKTAIEEVAALLKSIPDKNFQIEGHTDNVPIKTSQFASNWELASARAINVHTAMLNAGMTPERISAASFGPTRPIADNAVPEGKSANRRIEIVVIPDLSSLPGFEELSKIAK